MKLTFLGGAGTVTGSKTLLEDDGLRLLVDCGLFQGLKDLRLRNRAPLPVAPDSLDTVILTHAHLDHSGYLPLLVKNGFQGVVHATEATVDLCGILLPDSGYLQEHDAAFANKHGFSKHKPALPLYTREDAESSLDRFHPAAFDAPQTIGSDLRLTFRPAGHILGAAQVLIEQAGRRLLFSGDIGRPNDPVMVDPAPGGRVDFLVVESTYGGRRHATEDADDLLAEVIRRTAARGGTVVMPAFAVGRAQSVMYRLMRLKAADRIPDLPIFLDSPMAIDASELFFRHHRLHRLDAEDVRRMGRSVRYVRTVDQSKGLDANHVPKVIITASGMATGGRVLHHLKYFAPDSRNTILFAGFQAPGTRGEALVNGAREVKIHGRMVRIRAEVENLDMLSAHADEDEILTWLRSFEAPPRTTYINHGDAEASDSLRHRIEHDLGWRCAVPADGEQVDLTA